jgi:hypothetical protein
MEAVVRKPFQGVTNIIRFNWHFYAIGASLIFLLIFLNSFFESQISIFVLFFVILTGLSIFISLLVSYYVYDLSGLYKLQWLDQFKIDSSSMLVNINAGFDETSQLLRKKFPHAPLRVVDFYDPSKHTEVSIKRARRAYAIFEGTETIITTHTFLKEASADFIFLILAAHEIRDQKEREGFFIHLRNALKENGKIVVVEHLRNFPNFIAYTLGVFHFYSKKNWKKVFQNSGLIIARQQNITPFIIAFTLKKNGTAS